MNDLTTFPTDESAAKAASSRLYPDSTMTPLERYQADLKRPDFFHDTAQENAVRHLQRLYDDLVGTGPQAAATGSKLGLFDRLLGKKSQTQQKEPIKGLYFWGGVGRGKTYLVDTFYDALPFEQKMRTHFHRFMKRVHEEMKTLKGEKNPLTIIAKRFANEARVICFDEFFVSDITDAMILATLLEELFKNGVSLVATSNIVPDGSIRTACSVPVSCRRSPCSRRIRRSSTSTVASIIACAPWSRPSCTTGRWMLRRRRVWSAASTACSPSVVRSRRTMSC